MRKIEGIKSEIRKSMSKKELDQLAIEDRIIETNN